MKDKGLHALGARALACRGWCWMPGMLDVLGWRYSLMSDRVGKPTLGAMKHGWACMIAGVQSSRRPDLADPATLGCLLALVREAWGKPHMTTKRNPALGWLMIEGHEDLFTTAADTEAEALICALENAP
jgi:hypothetical protein